MLIKIMLSADIARFHMLCGLFKTEWYQADWFQTVL